MNEFWNQAEGQVINGLYHLDQCVSAAKDGAVYLTRVGDGPAVIRVRDAASANAGLLLDRWTSAVQLSHPNLIRILDVGRSELRGTPIVYALMERADETLATVLMDRTLTESETREMLGPTLATITWLHGRGFVQGAIRPSNVMAIGETLKLSSDSIERIGEPPIDLRHTIQDAPELEGGVVSAASDVWALGALLFHALTMKSPKRRDGILEGVEALPEPFARIVRHCLVIDQANRWTAVQIANALNGPEELPVRAAPTTFKPSFALPEPRRAPTLALEEPEKSRRPRWLIPAIVAALLLAFLIAWIAQKPRSAATLSNVPTTGAAASPAPIDRPVTSTALLPSKPAGAPLRLTRREAARRADNSWYVVVATYTQRGGAEKRAVAITRRWPAFKARVYEPPVENPHHLVVIGSNLTEQEAEALRQRARAAGLPRDVYIRKFPG